MVQCQQLDGADRWCMFECMVQLESVVAVCVVQYGAGSVIRAHSMVQFVPFLAGTCPKNCCGG